MEVRQMELDDFFEIKQNLKGFWGERHSLFRPLHHSMMIYEFGKAAFVVKSEGQVIAYLMGMLSKTADTAYVHLVAVKPKFRGKKLARLLYDHFIKYAKSNGYKKVKAVTSPKNQLSIDFHQKIGMTLLGETNDDGIPVMKDYSGPGEDLVVFEKII